MSFFLARSYPCLTRSSTCWPVIYLVLPLRLTSVWELSEPLTITIQSLSPITHCNQKCCLFHHDDFIKWKHFPCYWPFVRGIHRSPANSLHKGQWCRALMFFFYLHLNKRLGKQWGCRWFQTPSCSLQRHCNDKTFTTGCTESCQNHNFWCSQWWEFCQMKTFLFQFCHLFIQYIA